jgi:hypothetical protein
MAVFFSVTILGAVSISSRTVRFCGRRGRGQGRPEKLECVAT